MSIFNPCKKCLVRATCNNTCENFEVYKKISNIVLKIFIPFSSYFILGSILVGFYLIFQFSIKSIILSYVGGIIIMYLTFILFATDVIDDGDIGIINILLIIPFIPFIPIFLPLIISIIIVDDFITDKFTYRFLPKRKKYEQ